MAPCNQPPSLRQSRAWRRFRVNIQSVPCPALTFRYRHGWGLGSRVVDSARKSSCRNAWSCVRRPPAGIRLRIPHRGCNKPSRRPSHITHLARTLLGRRGHIRVRRPRPSPSSGECGLPSSERAGAREGLVYWKENTCVHQPSWRDAQEALGSVRLCRSFDDRYVELVVAPACIGFGTADPTSAA